MCVRFQHLVSTHIHRLCAPDLTRVLCVYVPLAVSIPYSALGHVHVQTALHAHRADELQDAITGRVALDQLAQHLVDRLLLRVDVPKKDPGRRQRVCELLGVHHAAALFDWRVRDTLVALQHVATRLGFGPALLLRHVVGIGGRSTAYHRHELGLRLRTHRVEIVLGGGQRNRCGWGLGIGGLIDEAID